MSMVALARPETSFSDRVLNLLEKVDYRIAINDEERDQIHRLRYDAYLREGAIVPNFSKRLSDRYDDLDNTWTFGVFIEEDLVGTLRVSVATAAYPELPALRVFPEFIQPQLEAGWTVIDPTRFVCDTRFSKAYPELPYITTRIGWLAGEHFGADRIVATARIEHQAFYKRVFGHELVCDARPYPALIKPLSLMSLDYFGMKDRVHRRYPFFRSTYFERRMLFGVPGMQAEWAPQATGDKTASSRRAVTPNVAAMAV